MANTNVTIARSKAYNLSLQEIARGYSHKFHVDYSDVALGTGSTDTVTLTLGALPSAWVVENALVNVSTAFAGTTAFTIIVGTTTTTNASAMIERSIESVADSRGICRAPPSPASSAPRANTPVKSHFWFTPSASAISRSSRASAVAPGSAFGS